MILYVINYLRGTLKIKINGSYIERFFNVCAKNDIDLWNINKVCIDEMHCNILVSDYKVLLSFVNNTKCTVEVLEKRGFPPLLKRFRKRYMFFAGLIMAFSVYFTLTNYVWQININGTDKTALVYEALDLQNIKIGTKLSDISAKDAQNNILSLYDDFLWFAVTINGNSLNVDIKERTETPEIIDKTEYCDIIAEKSGMIDSIDVLYGEKMIEIGQTFASGDVLVSSEMKSYPQVVDYETRFVHSMADIKANVWYNFESILIREMDEKKYTGKEITKYTLIFSNKAINLFKNSGNPYLFYDKIVDVKEIHLSESVTIPIKLKTETYIEYEKTPVLLNADFGVDLLCKNLYGDILKNIDGDILENKTTENVSDSIIRVSSDVTTLENIGIKIKR